MRQFAPPIEQNVLANGPVLEVSFLYRWPGEIHKFAWTLPEFSVQLERARVVPRRGRAMLRKLSEKVADCYRRARDARERAERASTEADEFDFLVMERHWMWLAESFELAERLSNFVGESDKRIAAMFAQGSDLAPAMACPGCGKPMQRIRINPPGSSASFSRTRLTCEACDVTALHAGRTTHG